jgi:predicted O-methyltransferase YrrM
MSCSHPARGDVPLRIDPRKWKTPSQILLIGTLVGLSFGAVSVVLWPGEVGLGGSILILLAGVAGANSLVAFLDFVRRRFQQLEGGIRDVQSRIEETSRQQLALTNIRPLLGPLPVPFGGWAINPFFGEEIVFTLMDERPKLVVECGSGSSTALIAACLRQLGQGRLIALEHDARFARRTESLLTLHGLNEVAKVIEAPLEKLVIDDLAFEWYSDVLGQHIHEDIDVLVVDGPPGDTGPFARYPAVPLLKKALSPNCVILLDDANRTDEQWIGKKWAEELCGSAEYKTHGNGSWVIRSPG